MATLDRRNAFEDLLVATGMNTKINLITLLFLISSLISQLHAMTFSNGPKNNDKAYSNKDNKNAIKNAMIDAIEIADVKSARIAIRKLDEVNFLIRGKSPLHLATEKNLPHLVDLLITRGADINMAGAEGNTPKQIAFDRNYEEISYLFSRVTLINTIEKKNTDDAIAEMDKIKSFDFLIRGKAPIHWATEANLKVIVHLLIKRGANVNFLSSKGETAAQIAFSLGFKEVYELLIKSDGTRGNTALPSISRHFRIDDFLMHGRNYRLFQFVYPLFFSDLEAFQKLAELFRTKKISNEQTMEILDCFAQNNFPNGAPTARARMALLSLLDELEVSDYFRCRILYSLEARNAQEEQANITDSKLYSSTNPSDWNSRRAELSQIKPSTLARALTFRESILFKRITLTQLSLWLRDETSAEYIQNYIDHNNRIRNLFSFILTSEPNQKIRDMRARKMVKLADEFLKLGNISGVQKVVEAITDSAVIPIISLNQKSQTRLNKLSELVANNGNFKKYISYIKSHKDQAVIPLVPLYFKKIKDIYNRRPVEIDHDWLSALVRVFNDISKIQKRSNYSLSPDPRLISFIDSIPFIPASVIEAYAIAEDPQKFSRRISLNHGIRYIKDCSAYELVKCIYQMELPNTVAIQLLDAEIWSGQHLDDFLAQGATTEEKQKLLQGLGMDENSAQLIRYHTHLNRGFSVSDG